MVRARFVCAKGDLLIIYMLFINERSMKKLNIFFLLVNVLNVFMISNASSQKPELILPVGHTTFISSVAFSSDLKRLVTAAQDGTAKIWDIQTGRILYSLEGHTSGINSAVISPDNKWVLTASYDSTAKIWDLQTGKIIHTLEKHSAGVSSAFFSPDGKLIITTSLNDITRIWDAQTFNLLHVLIGHSSEIETATYHEMDDIRASISSDGKYLVTASRDGVAKIWNVQTGKLIHSLKGTGWISSVVFSAYDVFIITTSRDGTANIWDAKKGKLLETFEQVYHTATLSPDLKQLLAVNNNETAEIYDVETGEFKYDFSEDIYTFQNTSSAVFSPDGRYVATSGDPAKIWDAQTGHLLFSLKGPVPGTEAIAFSPDSKWVITTGSATMWDGTAIIWDVQSGKILRSFEGHTTETTHASFSSDGKLLITASTDDNVKLWNMETGKWLHTFKGHTNWITSATFSPDSRFAVTSSDDNSAIIWDVRTGALIHSLKGHTNEVNSAVFSPDDSLILTASQDKTAKIWDIQTGALLHSLEGNNKNISSAVFSPNGKLILTGSDDFIAKIWDAGTGKLLHSLDKQEEGIYSAGFSPDSKLIVTLSFRKHILLWDAETGNQLEDYGYQGPSVSDPNNKWIADMIFDKSVKIWDAKSGKIVETMIPGIFSVSDNNNDIYAIDRQNNRFLTQLNSKLTLSDLNTGKELLSWVAIDSTDWAVIHPSGLFDASPGAMEKMYYVQESETIELNQLKDRYYEPGLWGKVLGTNTEPLRNVSGFGKIMLPPAINLSVTNDVLNIGLENRGGGIGKYMIYINGKEVYTGNLPESGIEFRGGSVLSSTFSLKDHKYLLPGGDNEIEVKAYNGDNYIISHGKKISYDQGGAHSAEKPRIFIISIGISDYTGNLIDLRYAAKDANNISKALTIGAKTLFGADETYTFNKTTDDADRSNWPTKDNIIKTFAEVSKQAKSSDVLVVYLSGHGMNWGGQDGDFYYLTQDAYGGSSDVYSDPVIRGKTTISSSELTDLIKSVSALKEVLIIDACASGRAVENLMAKRDISSSTLRALDRMKDRIGLHIITGCAADAVSYEASRYGQGVLTYSVLEGIKGASLREEKFVDVAQLFQYCTERVPQLAEGIGGIQQPQVFSPYGESSFDIGEILSTDKPLIPLAVAKPMFLMSSLKDKETFDDVLGIEKIVDDKLRDVSSKAASSMIIFIEAKEYPEAYRIRGAYSITGDQVDITVNLFLGNEKAGSFNVKGKKSDMEKLAEEIVTKAQQIIK
jgi:WD40 repeat protein